MPPLRENQHYEYRVAIDIDTAHKIMTDADCLTEMRIAAGDTPLAIEIEFHERGSVVKASCEARSGLPRFISKLISKQLYIELTIAWDRGEEYDVIRYHAEIGRGAGVISGEAKLYPDGDGVIVRDNCTVSVDYPVLRRPLLKYISRKAQSSMADDFEYARGISARLAAA